MNELTEPKEGTGKNEILKGISNIIKSDRKKEKKKSNQSFEYVVGAFSLILGIIFIVFFTMHCTVGNLFLAIQDGILGILFFLVGTGISLKLQIRKSEKRLEKKIRKLLKEVRP